MEQGSLRLLTNGQTVFNRYRLKMLVGKGAMGVVWRAEDLELNLDIALKFLAEEFLFDASAIADLKRETRRGMALAHPAIVRIFGFFQDAGYAAIAMEYVEGNTLGTLQAARREPFFEVDEIAEWARQLCGALDYAHREAMLVHRDLKPGNLMIDARGRLKVADFGIAAELNAAHTRVAVADDTRGTLSYMSPQQLLGQRPCVDHDIYSLGATLYDLLTGRPPFSTGDVSLQVRTVVPPSLAARREENGHRGAAIPPAWEETVAACLAKDASLRPPSAAAVAERLGLGAVGFAAPAGRGTANIPTAPLAPATSAPTAQQAASVPRLLGTHEKPPSGAVVVSPPTALQAPAAAARPNFSRTSWVLAAAGGLALIALMAGLGVYWGAQLSRPPQSLANHKIVAAEPPPAAGAVPEISPTPPASGDAEKADATTRKLPKKAIVGPDGKKRPPPMGIPPRSYLPAEPKPIADRPMREHSFVLPESGLAMIWIPHGNNFMGTPAPPGMPDGPPANESRLTDVFFTEGFWLGKFEVTRGQFTRIMGFDPSQYPLTAEYPVCNVTWDEAVGFCRKFTDAERKLGRLPDSFVYTLPTEAQWEYAAKSGFTDRWGSHESVEKAAWGVWSKVDWPQPIGKLVPNAWGLHDMFGNVAEWCRDWYADRHPGGRVDDYAGPSSGTQRLFKGGSFSDDDFMMRASVRTPAGPSWRDPHVGFRLALVRAGNDK